MSKVTRQTETSLTVDFMPPNLQAGDVVQFVSPTSIRRRGETKMPLAVLSGPWSIGAIIAIIVLILCIVLAVVAHGVSVLMLLALIGLVALARLT